MKLSKDALAAIWDVHAWVGVGAGLVLHVICFSGALSVFHDEIGAWQDPQLRVPHGEVRPLSHTVQPILDSGRLDPRRIDVFLPGEQRNTIDIRYAPAPGAAREMLHVHPRSGEVTPDRSRLASILFQVHFLQHDRWFPQGKILAGLFGVAMLLGLATGFVLHFRNIVRHLHQFRPTKRPVIAWTDAHKVLAVFGVPFQTTAAFTGAMICLGPVLLSLFVGPLFRGDFKAAEMAIFGDFSAPAASGQPARPLDLDRLVERARNAVPGIAVKVLQISHYGDAEGTVAIHGERDDTPMVMSMVRLRLRDGAIVHLATPEGMAPAQSIEQWIGSLHFAKFGGWSVKVLYCICGLAACLTILSGNWVWLLRRETSENRASHRILSKLTAGAGGGIVLATAVTFCANRCIPMNVPSRLTAESSAFFGTWALVLVACLAAPSSRRSWAVLLAASGVLFALLPFLDALTAPVHLFNVGHHGVWSVAGIDLALFAFGCALLAAARLVHAAPGVANRGVQGGRSRMPKAEAGA